MVCFFYTNISDFILTLPKKIILTCLNTDVPACRCHCSNIFAMAEEISKINNFSILKKMKTCAPCDYLLFRKNPTTVVTPVVDTLGLKFCLHYSTGTHKTTMFIYGRVGQPSHRAVYSTYMQICTISSNIYKRRNRSTKAGHENPPKKPAGGKNTGNVYPRPRQWCNPWGLGYASA